MPISAHEIIRFITLHGLFVSLALTAGMLAAGWKSRRNILFFLLFLSFFFNESSVLVITSGYSSSFPLCIYMGISSYFMMGPTLFFLLVYTLNGTISSLKAIIAHYTPAIAALIILLLLNTGVPPLDAGIVQLVRTSPVFTGVSVLSAINMSVYLVLIGRMARNSICWSTAFSGRKRGILIMLCVIYISYCSGLLIDTAYYISGNSHLLNAAGSIIPLASTILFLILFRYPDTFSAGLSYGIAVHTRSYLDEIDTEALIESVDRLLIEEKLFRDEECTLPFLAQQLDITPHQLSELINRHMNSNFSSLINRYRIEYGCALLRDRPDTSILDICFETGFNSKSAFNRAFREITGMTPRQYRTELKGKGPLSKSRQM